MSKYYSKELLDKMANEHWRCIIVFDDNDVCLGDLTWNLGDYEIIPPSINEPGTSFRRSTVKQIVLFNGLVIPKVETKKQKLLNILELNELVNKAGYEFI